MVLVTSQQAVAFAGERTAESQKRQPSAAATYSQVRVSHPESLQGGAVSQASIEDIPAFGTPEFRQLCEELDHRSLSYRAFKRLFDFMFALIVVTIGLIPGALLCIAIAADTKGSPIYSQERIGKRGKPFRIYKFRSMVKDSDNVEKYFTPEQLETWKRERKVEDDPRITKLGSLLRRTSVDEMPQFINVLVGQLSVIGPRPITAEELMQHFSQTECCELLSIRPGITGLWQATDRNSASFKSGRRQEIELQYVRRCNISMDVKCFIGTFGAMFGKDATGR